MKRVLKISAISAAFALTLSFTASPSQGASKPALKILKLLWSDEFTGKVGTTPNSKNWAYDLGNSYGWGNSELEYYTKSPANASLNGKGQLLITANRITDLSGATVGTVPGTEQILRTCPECQFTSAKIKSANKLALQYGRIEIRMKNPVGAGTWPAFWLLGTDLIQGNPWPECGEIDVIEARGAQPQLAFGTLHGPSFTAASAGGFGSTFNNDNTPLSNDFHTYAIEWKVNRVDFYVDDSLYFSGTPAGVAPGRWVFNHKFFLILNLAMGGQFTGDLDPDMNQAQLAVDYIRYYSINGVGKLTKGL